jgi:predicted DNA-binding transcriptional regulator YafY
LGFEEDAGDNAVMERAQNKIRRILLLVDSLAPWRRAMTLSEIHTMMIDRLADVTVCDRTLRRDLELLESLGMLHIDRPNIQTIPATPWRYKFLLKRTEAIQGVAIEVATACKP